MRILLDECVNAGLKKAFPNHAVQTVSGAGWRGIHDRPLLALAESKFDVFVTIDSNIDKQCRLADSSMGFLILAVRDNRIESYRDLFPLLESAAQSVRPGGVIHLRSPDARNARR